VEPAGTPQASTGPVGRRLPVARFADELEQRICALESPLEPDRDFDAVSWWYIGGLGFAVPILLIAIGWWL